MISFNYSCRYHFYAIALHFVYYNFCRIHKTLRVTPAMEAKLTTKPMTIQDIVTFTYADEIATENKRKERITGNKNRLRLQPFYLNILYVYENIQNENIT